MMSEMTCKTHITLTNQNCGEEQALVTQRKVPFVGISGCHYIYIHTHTHTHTDFQYMSRVFVRFGTVRPASSRTRETKRLHLFLS